MSGNKKLIEMLRKRADDYHKRYYIADALLLSAIDALEAAEVRAGVVAEEPEWEYGIRLNQTGTVDKVILWPEHEVSNPFSGTRVRRIRSVPAGPWVPVKQEGAGHEGDS